jgi:AcrR family transcriptional regulator
VTEKAPRPRGRPKGRSARGEQTRALLYQTALTSFSREGYDTTTLRSIAKEAGVSPGLMYRYFPSKPALVMALYDELSTGFAASCERLPEGKWPARVRHTLDASLAVLRPHRDLLASVLPVLLADREHGLLSREAHGSRSMVRDVFERAVVHASRPPSEAAALGRLMYLAHLGIILWWVLDRSTAQRATGTLVQMLQSMSGIAATMVKVPGVAGALVQFDQLATEALYDDPI